LWWNKQHGRNTKRLPETVYLRFQVAFGYLCIGYRVSLGRGYLKTISPPDIGGLGSRHKPRVCFHFAEVAVSGSLLAEGRWQ
jgi:hypothetical protein